MNELELGPEEARSRLYEILNRDAPFESKVQQALELGESYLGVENAYLSRVDPQTDTWEAIASTDSGNGPFPPGQTDLETTYCRRALERDTAMAIHDARSQGWDGDPAFETHGLACYHGTAITIDDNDYGVVCFVSRAPREPFTHVETMFAELLARLLEQELERRQHEAKLDRRSDLITVLNRVLRHNLRNSMTVIRANASMAGKEFRWPPQELRSIIDRADELIDLSEKARKLDGVGNYDCQETDLTALLERLAESIRAEYPSASITVTGGKPVPLAVQPSLETALYELLENAAKHGGEDPEVTASISRVPNGVEITIADDGPGLPKMEQEVLTAGTETPLSHGQGLGLWLAYWVVTSHDGHIDTTVSDSGTRMCIELPRDVSATGSWPREGRDTQLRHVQDKFRTVFDEASDAMVLVDNEERIIDANESAGTLLNRQATELLGHSMAEFVGDGSDFQTAWQGTSAVSYDRGTVELAGADSEEQTAEYTTTTNVVTGEHLIALRDVTDRNAS